jgi:hypothetical protein
MTTEATAPAEEEEDAFDGLFYLPVAGLKFYDDPYDGYGDDGYDVESLKEEVIRDGGILQPIAVGMSDHDMREKGDKSICAYNGNHRLAVAKELGYAEMLCENSYADDAVPLTWTEIEALGGRAYVESPAPGPA